MVQQGVRMDESDFRSGLLVTLESMPRMFSPPPSLTSADAALGPLVLSPGALSVAAHGARRCCGVQGRTSDGAPRFPTPGTSSAKELANVEFGSAGRPSHSR